MTKLLRVYNNVNGTFQLLDSISLSDTSIAITYVGADRFLHLIDTGILVVLNLIKIEKGNIFILKKVKSVGVNSPMTGVGFDGKDPWVTFDQGSGFVRRRLQHLDWSGNIIKDYNVTGPGVDGAMTFDGLNFLVMETSMSDVMMLGIQNNVAISKRTIRLSDGTIGLTFDGKDYFITGKTGLTNFIKHVGRDGIEHKQVVSFDSLSETIVDITTDEKKFYVVGN